jgi:hypothetical protein
MFLRRLTINWNAPDRMIRVTSALPREADITRFGRPLWLAVPGLKGTRAAVTNPRTNPISLHLAAVPSDFRSHQVMDPVGNLSFALRAMPAFWMSPYA